MATQLSAEQKTSPKNGIIATDAAMAKIAAITHEEENTNALRVSVEGGGCSGFSYKFDLVKDSGNEGDTIIERNGARVLIDSISLMYMEGSVLDFIDDLMGQTFKIENPNAVASCGCGTSFSV